MNSVILFVHVIAWFAYARLGALISIGNISSGSHIILLDYYII